MINGTKGTENLTSFQFHHQTPADSKNIEIILLNIFFLVLNYY